MSKFNGMKKLPSQFDSSQTEQLSFDDNKFAHRQIEIKDYDRFEVTYEGSNISRIDYYRDDQHAVYELGFGADVAGNVNDTYWFLNGPKNTDNYYIWYSVNGSGTDPLISNRTGIRVDINTNDGASIIAAATQLTLTNSLPKFFQVTRTNAVVKLTYLARGVVDDPANFNVPIMIINELQEGTEDLIRYIELEYDLSGCVTNYKKVEIDVLC